jgi:hypothetical protein
MRGMSDQKFDDLVDECLAGLANWRQSMTSEPYTVPTCRARAVTTRPDTAACIRRRPRINRACYQQQGMLSARRPDG